MLRQILKTILSNSFISFTLARIIYCFKRKEIISDDSPHNLNYLLNIKKDTGNSCLLKYQNDFNKTYDLAIIVPCYNVEKYIKDCVDSLLKQKTKFKYQIIFVDDGSSDSTFITLNKLCSNIPFITILHQTNGGAASARNLGIRHSSASYITFVDADDLISNDSLIENIMTALPCDKKGTAVVEYKFSNSKCNRKSKKTIIIEAKAIDLKGFACGKFYSSQLFSNIGFPEGYAFEDTINTLIIFPLANHLYLSSEKGYVYRERPDNSSHTSFISITAIDTFYVTKQLLHDAQVLGLTSLPDYSNLVMRQVVCNFKRILKMDRAIKEAIFVETRKLIKNICLQPKTKLKYRNVYNALEKCDYTLYTIACSIIQ